MQKAKSLWFHLFGDPDKLGSEKHFITITTFVASVFLLFLCVVHIIMGLRLAPVILAGSSSIVMMGLYYFVRYNTCLFIPKLVLTSLGLIMLDFTWYSKFLSNGPVLFFILIFGALVIWVWEGKSLVILLCLYFLNLAILGTIEALTPKELMSYPEGASRSLDIYLSFFFYSVLLISILYIVKKEFIRQKEKAQKSDKLKSAFLANMSHEIRTPLNAIVGFSELLGKTDDSKSKQEYINIIQNSSANLLHLINDILDLSKIESEDLELQKKQIKILDLFSELREVYSLELANKEKTNVHLSFIQPELNYIIESDPYRLKQILSNLISNAIKFTSNGSIVLSCVKENNELIFKVSDTGTGIPEEDQAKIFDRFIKHNYQGLNNEGTGIGLPISKKLVSMLSGRIWVSSIPGKGSDFFFTIPYLASADQSSPQKESQKMSLSPNIESGKSILIVEDDQMSYLLIKEILKDFNVSIHHVSDGAEAIEIMCSNADISLILMDLGLPKINGYEATKAIKEIYPNIPIIAQSANAMIEDLEKVENAGIDEYITKPLDMKKIRDLISQYLFNSVEKNSPE